jgi:multiple sugar transport system substrate-binding protein
MKARIKAALRLLSLAVMMAVPLLKSQRSAAAEPVTIDFWIFQDFLAGDAGVLMKQFATEFETANSGIKINLVGKKAPDIISGAIMGAGSGALPDAITTQLQIPTAVCTVVSF